MSAGAAISLREVGDRDLPVFFEQQSDEGANQMAAFTSEDPQDREAFSAHWKKILADSRITIRAIESGGELAGYLASFERWELREVSYWLGREYWGRGVATAALEAFLLLVRERPLYARAATDNVGSLRVLEKCGFEISLRERGFAEARGQEIEEVLLILA